MAVINVGRGGTFAKTGSYATTPGEVDDLIKMIADSTHKSVTVHFHGGLVSEASGLGIATRLEPVYEAGDSFPVFFVWETGVGETLRNKWRDIFSGKLFEKLFDIAFGLLADNAPSGGKGFGGAQVSPESLEAALRTSPIVTARGGAVDDDEMQSLIQDQALAKLVDIDLETLVEDGEAHGFSFTVAEGGKGFFSLAAAAQVLGATVVAAIRRFRANRDHGLYCSLAEELARRLYLANIGEFLWNGMKAAAEDMWKPNDGLNGEGLHAGRYFLERLAGAGKTVNLVGHSAGSIAICHMLAAAREAGLMPTINKLILLAPAVRIDLFAKHVLGHDDVGQVLMFTMSDEAECSDQVAGRVYPRSLLYLVSGAFEDEADQPLLGLYRHSVEGRGLDSGDVDKTRTFFADSQRLVMSPTDSSARPGRRCTSLRHGDFDDDSAMLETLTELVRA